MSKLFWQLPWAGPSKGEGGAPAWSVMPSPGMGDAMAVCVPVTVDESQTVVLAVGNMQQPIALVAAPMGAWTTLTGIAGKNHTGFLCLMGYDQPAGSTGESYSLPSPSGNVNPVDLAQALISLQQHAGVDLAKQVLREPAVTPAQAPGRVGSGSRSASLTLAFASCQYPSGLMDGLPAEASLQRLADLLDRPHERHPERLLLLGDQIYADATAGLLDPIRLDDRYRVPYEELMHVQPLRSIMQSIPVNCMLDDHEIADNWEPYVRGAQGKRFSKGLAAYWTYQRGSAPKNQTWFDVPGNAWSLFMADTRTCRDARREGTLSTASILGALQSDELEQWLQQQPTDDLKLVATPAMLLPRLVEHADEPLHLDGWQGYPASLNRLLAFLCDKRIDNVCFLSGDAHLGCDVSITLTGPNGKTVKTRSIHSPALYAPLPFANEHHWNLKIPDSFAFPGPQGAYSCEVEGRVFLPPRDGCCLLTADRAGTTWNVDVEVV